MKKNKNQWIDDGGTNYHSVENNKRENESAKWKKERERVRPWKQVLRHLEN